MCQVQTTIRRGGLATAMFVLMTACTYDPPPEVTLVTPANKIFVIAEPIYLEFSEPVQPGSLEVRVWPGQKDLYTLEKERKPGVEAVMDTCTVASSPCAGGKVTLGIDAALTRATLLAESGAFGPVGTPLVLEVTGALSDEAGQRKKVSVFFDFQIAEEIWGPKGDVTANDGDNEEIALEPLGIPMGRYLFAADFTSPVKLSQQFWTDLRADDFTGEFVMLLTDADPVKNAPINTSDPKLLVMDTGDEGFIFAIQGKVHRDEEDKLVFKGDPVTLTQKIGPITFELRDMVIAGSIVSTGDKIVWDGTLAVKEVYYEVGGKETIYPADQANFQIRELAAEDVPEGMPTICMKNPCVVVGGRCDLLPQWPPSGLCDGEE